MTLPYWPFEDAFAVSTGSSGGPVDQVAAFQSDVGAPITRRRTTGRLDQWSLSVTFQEIETFEAFEDWFDDDIKAGSLPFVWRHPITERVAMFKFSPMSYSSSSPGGEWVRVGFRAMILPGALWFASYVMERSARPPDWVADYDADRYWIGQAEIAATGLSAISGEYTVLRKNADETIDSFVETYSGDVPQTAPTDTLWLAGYLNAT